MALRNHELLVRNDDHAIRVSAAKFDCNRLTTVQDIQDHACKFFAHIVD